MFESFYGNEMRNKLKKMTETFKRGRQQKTAQHLCCIYRPDPPRVPLCNRIPYSYCCLSYKNQQTQSIISPIISTESSSLPPTGRWIPLCLASPFLTLLLPTPLLCLPSEAGGESGFSQMRFSEEVPPWFITLVSETSLVTKLLLLLPDFRLLLCQHHSTDRLLCVMNDHDGLAGDFIFAAHAKKITCAGRTCKIIKIRLLLGPVAETVDRDKEEGM